MPGAERKSVIFLSYTSVDLQWALWADGFLSEEGFTVRTQAWESTPGKNLVQWINDMLREADKVLALYSRAYFNSRWCTAEWTSALAQNKLLPARIEPVNPPEILQQIIWVDLFGLRESEAKDAIRRLVGLQPSRRVVPFPGGTSRIIRHAGQSSVLSTREIRILAFEKQWWRYPGAKEAAIRAEFSLSPTNYYQILNILIDSPAALAADPMLVRRLRRLREQRRRARAGVLDKAL